MVGFLYVSVFLSVIIINVVLTDDSFDDSEYYYDESVPFPYNVEGLKILIQNDPFLGDELIRSVTKAHSDFHLCIDFDPTKTRNEKLDMIYTYLEMLERHIPNESDAYTYRNENGFYYLIGALRPSEGETYLDTNPKFQDWMARWVELWGDFLSLPDSRKYVQEYIDSNKIDMSQYEVPPEWTSFNHFFSRHLKHDERRIFEKDDDSYVVFPADSTFAQQCHIDKHNKISGETIKMQRVYDINQLLTGVDGKVSNYSHYFAGGELIHAYLAATDYHRYHVPVSGKVVDVVNQKKEWNYYNIQFDKFDTLRPLALQDTDDTGYQFTQTRGYMILKTKSYGFVAVVPVGMANVASVNIKVKDDSAQADGYRDVVIGDTFQKGDEFGWFLFGGSDIILLFMEQAEFKLNPAIVSEVRARNIIRERIRELHRAEQQGHTIDFSEVSWLWTRFLDMNKVIHRFQGQFYGKFTKKLMLTKNVDGEYYYADDGEYYVDGEYYNNDL